ncbi:MAG: hypothetical protein PHS59_16410 [Paludibacter sp.]|nr:hypothetical protein [Paludibacter sp.]
MEHEFKYDEQNEVLVLTLKNTVVFSDLEELYETSKKMLEEKSNRQLLLMMSGNFSFDSRETREASTENFKKMDLSEMAFVGIGAANRMLAKVLMKTGLIKINGDFFKEYTEAVKWLKSKR